MKALVQRAALEQSAQQAAGVASGAGALPVLAHVLLRAAPSNAAPALELTATDLDTTLRQRIKALPAGMAAGSLAVPAKLLAAAARALEGETVQVSAGSNGQLVLESGGAVLRLAALPAEQYPTTPQRPAKAAWLLPEGAGQRAFGRVLPVAGDFMLKLAQLRLQRKRLQAVATDGCRIVVAEEGLGEPFGDQEAELLFPARGLRVLVGLDGEFNCALVPGAAGEAAGHVAFWSPSGELELYVRRAEAQGFPDCIAALPRGAGQVAFYAERRGLLAVLRRLALAARGARLEWLPATRTLLAGAASSEVGSVQDVLRCEPAPAAPAAGGEPLAGEGVVHAGVAFLESAIAALEPAERVHVTWSERYVMVRPAEGLAPGSRCLFVIATIAAAAAAQPAEQTGDAE